MFHRISSEITSIISGANQSEANQSGANQSVTDIKVGQIQTSGPNQQQSIPEELILSSYIHIFSIFLIVGIMFFV